MPNNKVVLGDDVLIDISGDTVTPAVLLKGCTAHDKTGAAITGEMPDQGTKTATLDTSTTSYTIPEGKHSGSGKVSITTQEKSVTPSTYAQTVTPDSGKVLSKVSVGAVESATQATPSISVDSAGKITASATQEEGYVTAGTKSATKQLTTKGATTVTPTSSVQTIVNAGTYVTGDIKVAASTGKKVYSGTVRGNYTSDISINIGTTISSSAEFAMVLIGDHSSDYIMIVTGVVKNSGGTYVTNVDPTMSQIYGTVTYSGTSVSISASARFESVDYRWYLIQ